MHISKDKKYIILSAISVVVSIIAIIALFFPLWIPKLEGSSNITLGEATFGKTENGKELWGFSVYYFIPFILIVIALLLYIPQFFDIGLKLKNLLLFTTAILMVFPAAFYMAFNGEIFTSDTTLTSAIKLTYEQGYAHYIAAVSSFTATMIQCFQLQHNRKLKILAKARKQGIV